jgi:hypothetical protein
MSAPKASIGFRLFWWIAAAAVVVAVVAGFFVVGSPWETRKKAADQQRVNDLDMIARQVRDHYVREKSLPQDMSEIYADWYIERELKDPVTDKPYEYRPIGKDQFELCAVFETEAKEGDQDRYYYGEHAFRTHARGRVCFTLSASDDGPY